MAWLRRTALFLTLLGLGCTSVSSPTPEPPETAEPASNTPAPAPRPAFLKDAAGSVEHPALKELLEEHWRYVLETNPLWATQLGVRDFDAEIGDGSLGASRKNRRRLSVFLERSEALVDAGLNARDEDTRTLFSESLRSDLESAPCRFEEWSISPRGNPITTWNYLPELHTVVSTSDMENLLARYRRVAGAVDTQIANLKSGVADGLYANRESTRRVVDMVKRQVAAPLETWPLMKPALTNEAAQPDGTDESAALRKEMARIVAEEIRPAFERYSTFLNDVVLPKARSDDAVGLAGLPLGPSCYSARIRHFTTLPLDAKNIHETGLAEIRRIDEAMAKLGRKLFKTGEPRQEAHRLEVLRRLRSDPAMHFETEEEVEQKAEGALARARAAIPRFFGILPEADCVVRRVPDYEAPYTTIAYYRGPTPGAKPGEYFINVYQPTTRPRYEAEALAFHESIPGHHLQIAIAQELPALPAFRKHTGATAFVEGWALYTEQLADEMGLYSTDLDRMGMLSYEAWRAARLVVDTGIHAFGWSRDRAKAFMTAHTALAENNIDNEVDRYIVWPGQALAYKTGQMEIWRLRRAATADLGDKFDIRGFHDAVLGGGAVTLPLLRKRVQSWTNATSKTP